jgi:hypothetical protein
MAFVLIAMVDSIRRSAFCCVGLLGLLGLAGCYSAESDIVAVSGRVTLGGEPLAGAVVTMQPVDTTQQGRATGSVGRTDADGRYSLTLIEPRLPGAIVGEHRVTITTADSSANDAKLPTGERVPRRWRNGSQTFVVPAGGTSKADFSL